MVDKVVRGVQHRGQFAGKADQGPVEDGLLLGFTLFCLPPKLFGPQDGRDTPPEPLGRALLPRHVLIMRLPWGFLLWRAGRKKGEEEVSSLVQIR